MKYHQTVYDSLSKRPEVNATTPFLLVICVEGYLVYVDPNPTPHMVGKDTVYDCCNSSFVILKSYHPEQLVLYDRAKGETVLEGVIEYFNRGDSVVVMSATEEVYINCSTGKISIRNRQ